MSMPQMTQFVLFSWSLLLSYKTPLHLAVMACNSGIVSDLLEEGARANIPDKVGVAFMFT